jgi:iron complex outermembrane receptor protein
MRKSTALSEAIRLVITAGALGVSAQALAQEQEQTTEPTTTGEDGQVIEEIITTGSRIKKDVFSSSTPIDVVLAEDASNRGLSDVAALLQSTTVAAGSPQVTTAISSAFVTNGGEGVETLSLRGLGANRTLTLINGRRAGPAGTRGGVSAVDLNVIPLSAVERVDILKDGASSVYGSDAVAGVVNIITKKGDGGQIDGFVSMPSKSGGEKSQISASWGKSFSRGNFRITGEYNKQSELAKGQRDYFMCAEQYIFDPTTGERRDIVDPRTGTYACRDWLWGHVWVYDYQLDYGTPDNNWPGGSRMQYDYDGDLGNYIPPLAPAVNEFNFVSPPGWYPVGYDRTSAGPENMDHPFQNDTSLVPQNEKTTLFIDGEYRLTDSITAYGELLMNQRKTKVNGYRQFWGYIYNGNNETWGVSNSQYAGWEGLNWLSPTPITDHNDSLIDVKYTRLMAGLAGEFGNGWSWDVHAQYSRSDGDYTWDQIYNDSIWDQNWLYDGYQFADGSITPDGSCVGQVTSVRGVPCQDIPWVDPAFLNGEVSPEMRDFLFGVETGNTKYTQWDIEAFVTGDLFQLPAGTMAGAFGVNFRHDEINDVPGPITLAGNAWGSSTAGITKGDDQTKAIFGEVDVPLLRDMELVNSLDLTASFRYTDVDSYGNDTTYKVGMTWQVVPSIMFRAGQGTSFRTPALFELYLADQTSFIGQRAIDPCINWGENLAAGSISQRLADNCAADGIAPDFAGAAISATIVTGGGLGVLEAETSTSNTVGVVWTPEFANINFAVDYYDIEIKNEVDQLGASTIVSRCYNSEFFPNEPLCGLFDRDPALDNMISEVRDSYINIATQNTRGVDFNLLYRTDLPFGMLTFNAQATRMIENVQALFEDTVTDYNGRLGYPEWVGNISAILDRDAWSFYWRANYIGSASNESWYGDTTINYFGEPVRIVINTDSVTYHTFSVSREFEDYGLTARLGVSNAFDTHPPQVSSLGAGANVEGKSALYSQYDWFGRAFFLQLSKTF